MLGLPFGSVEWLQQGSQWAVGGGDGSRNSFDKEKFWRGEVGG